MVYLGIAATVLLGLLADAHASLRTQTHRKLSFESIARYEPKSLVTDHNAIDLDQAEMVKQLALETMDSYANAKAIYTDGAFSKSVARVTLTAALTSPLNGGTTVSGKTEDGMEVAGKVLDDYPADTTVLEIQYQTNAIQNNYVGCQVGANPNPFTEGCFASTGLLSIDGEGTFEYNYSQLKANVNKRTLQGFSTGAEDKMFRCENCPYVTYEKFYQYYGAFDYANQWVLAAFEGSTTRFAKGNANFGNYEYAGRKEAIIKGTAYMNVFMYVIREMEDALDDCKDGCDIANCNDDPVHAWDEAVAFYTGSLELLDGSGSGVLMHQLADKRCANFKTCGDLASETSGTSHANLEIFRQFKDGQRQLVQGQCSAARANKERIEQLMAIPLIQGTIRYAYITDTELEPGEKADAEGAVFAAAVLPLVNACSEDDADIIYRNMKTGQNGSANFKHVKQAFERNYDCMGIRCADIGGLYNSATGGYLKDAAPCGSSQSSASNANVPLFVGLSFAGLAALVFLAWACNRCSNRKEVGKELPEAHPTVVETELKGEGVVIS